jgi:hypothetical protein
LVCDFAPALLAYGQGFAFYLDVEFYVFAFAGVFPGVFTMFHSFFLSKALCRILLLNGLQKLLSAAGEGWVKVNFKHPALIGKLRR